MEIDFNCLYFEMRTSAHVPIDFLTGGNSNQRSDYSRTQRVSRDNITLSVVSFTPFKLCEDMLYTLFIRRRRLTRS